MTVPFTPTADDMADARYGVLISTLGEEGDAGMIAVGSLDPRRALAAFHWFLRTRCGGPVLGTASRDEFHDDLLHGHWLLAPHPTVFVRACDGGWTATPTAPDAPSSVPAVWLHRPWDDITRS